MVVWGVLIVLFVLDAVATVRLVPLEHRQNYAKCRKEKSYYLAVLLWHSIWIVAAVLGGEEVFPSWLRVVGVAYYIVGSAAIISARRVNYFFLPILVYIPLDLRATTGIYGFCRHPGYLGLIATAWGMCLLLGQLWAVIPTAAYVGLISRRMVVEDRLLYGN
jgi:protein-S-isoprenylcysteine O-methyltransferase Ste14